MELWDTLIVTQDLYGGQQYCENVTQWSPTLIKKRVLGCEFCSEVNNTLPFWKEVLLVSVHVIVLFFFPFLNKKATFSSPCPKALK